MLLTGIGILVKEVAVECPELLLYIQVTCSNLGIGIEHPKFYSWFS
jgi:hypothetical protein